MRHNAVVLDERATPSLRVALGSLLARADSADFAVARIRLVGLDLSARELRRMRRCRVLVRRIDADTLADMSAAARRESGAADRLLLLGEFLASGRVEVRASGMAGWTPDFSVLRLAAAGRGDGPATAAVVGAHYFSRPYPQEGPSFTCIVTTAAAVRRVEARFDELWRRAYDVKPVIRTAIDQLLGTDEDRGEPSRPTHDADPASTDGGPASRGRSPASGGASHASGDVD